MGGSDQIVSDSSSGGFMGCIGWGCVLCVCVCAGGGTSTVEAAHTRRYGVVVTKPKNWIYRYSNS